MYFLDWETRRRIMKGLRRRARMMEVAEDLRGWSWDHPPMEPPYDVYVPLYEVAGRYCPTGRDIYLRRVERVTYPPTPAMIEGLLYHLAVSEVISKAKTFLYREGIHPGSVLSSHLEEAMTKRSKEFFKELEEQIAASGMGEEHRARVEGNVERVWRFQAGQIAASVDRVLAKHPYIGIDALVHTAIPVVVEQKLDGRHLGLSGQLSIDAFAFEALILDLKTGNPMPFHRLTTTGYALVYESLTETPIDVGCIVYLTFKPHLPVPRVSWDEHLIDEPLRQQFIEWRDTIQRIIAEEVDPGLPPTCYHKCPYLQTCQPPKPPKPPKPPHPSPETPKPSRQKAQKGNPPNTD